MAMTKHELRAALLRNGFTVAEFAGWVGVSPETVYRWGGTSGVPRWATRLLALIDQHGRAHVLGASLAGDPGYTTSRLAPPVGASPPSGYYEGVEDPA